jgi:hypothetical protein
MAEDPPGTAIAAREAVRDVAPAHALSETAMAYARKALSAATRRAYASHLRAWESWCQERGALPCPAAPALVANHLAELADAAPTRRSPAGSPQSPRRTPCSACRSTPAIRGCARRFRVSPAATAGARSAGPRRC